MINSPDMEITEPLVDTYPDLQKRCKQYRIVASMLFLLCIASIILLVCSIFYGFGCNGMKSSTMPKKLSIVNFLHVSDMHLDVYYNKSTSTKSFCRSIPNTLNVTPTAAPFEGPYGRVGCDSPSTLVKSSLDFMKSLSRNGKNIKFFVFSGDQVAHLLEKGFVNGTVADRVFSTLGDTARAMKNAFSEIPILPSIGNNDLLGDYILPKNKSYYERLLSIWKPLIMCSKCAMKVTTEEELRKTFLIGGYYKAEVKDEKLVLLQLNTNYWSQKCIRRNPGSRTTIIADAQLSWLKQQLKDARASGKVVITTGHILPGIDSYSSGSHPSFWAKNYTTQYIELVTKTYKDIVIGQLFGHIHKDELRVHRLNEAAGKDDVAFLLTAPGITPLYKNNPGFRIVSFNKNKRLLSDYEQYYMDIVLSTQNKQPIWMFDYSFGNKYLEHVPLEKREITGKVVSDVVDSFVNRTNMNKHWQNFIQHRQVNYQPDAYNRYKLYCAVKHVMKDAFDECVKKYPVTGG